MTNRQKVTAWLKGAIAGSVLDQTLHAARFVRPRASLGYRRDFIDVTQRLQIVFDVGPRYEPTAVAHVLPQIVLESTVLGDLMRQMTSGDLGPVPGDGAVVLWHQLQNLAPPDTRRAGTNWFIHNEDEVPGLLAQIKDFVEAWAIPFLDSYQDIVSLARGYEADDQRLHLDLRFYLYQAASYVHLGQPLDALHVLEKWFGRPAQRKRYAHVFQYVERRLKP